MWSKRGTSKKHLHSKIKWFDFFFQTRLRQFRVRRAGLRRPELYHRSAGRLRRFNDPADLRHKHRST
jgi:hypothetical protein